MAEVRAEMVANVWKVVATEGDHVDDGDILVILESMKMELSITAPHAGTVDGLELKPGDRVNRGQPVLAVHAHEGAG